MRNLADLFNRSNPAFFAPSLPLAPSTSDELGRMFMRVK